MSITPKQERFVKALENAMKYRQELLDELVEKVKRESKDDLSKAQVNWGRLSDIELDISYLEKLLHLEN